MTFERLRTGEILALIGAIGLLVVLALDWFTFRGSVADLSAASTGYASLGWFAVALLIFAAVSIVGLVLATAGERAPAFPVGLQTLAVVASLAALIAFIARLTFQPTLGVGATDRQVQVEPIAFAGLALAVLMLFGAWRSLGDERTDTPLAREHTDRLLSGANVDRPLPAVGEGTPW